MHIKQTLKTMEIVLQFDMPAVNFESQYKLYFKNDLLERLSIQSQNYTTCSASQAA